MGRLLPLRGEPETTPGEPRVLDLDDEATGEALSALSSETAREILRALYERPRTPPELREEVGTSLQNVHYHLEQLEDADLIEPAGTGYSEKGNEMTVYGPASQAVVLFAGERRHRSRLKEFLTRVLGAIVVLAAGSGLLGVLLDRVGPERDAGSYRVTSSDGTSGAVETGEKAAETTASPEVALGTQNASADTTFDAGNVSTDAAGESFRIAAETTVQPPLDPAVAFFLGGVFMLVVAGVWYYWSTRSDVSTR